MSQPAEERGLETTQDDTSFGGGTSAEADKIGGIRDKKISVSLAYVQFLPHLILLFSLFLLLVTR